MALKGSDAPTAFGGSTGLKFVVVSGEGRETAFEYSWECMRWNKRVWGDLIEDQQTTLGMELGKLIGRTREQWVINDIGMDEVRKESQRILKVVLEEIRGAAEIEVNGEMPEWNKLNPLRYRRIQAKTNSAGMISKLADLVEQRPWLKDPELKGEEFVPFAGLPVRIFLTQKDGRVAICSLVGGKLWWNLQKWHQLDSDLPNSLRMGIAELIHKNRGVWQIQDMSIEEAKALGRRKRDQKEENGNHGGL